MAAPRLPLGDYNIPQVGLGFWQVRDKTQFQEAFKAAIQTGYRHFDSAQIYKNEQMLGDAWSSTGLARDELFLTTKIWLANFPPRRLRASFDESLRKLQTDYVDLLLLHFPLTVFRKGAWRAMEGLLESGQVRSIGVSNYTIRHLESMKKYASIKPAVNQVELHVFLQQPELLEYCRSEGIIVEAYSPLAHARNQTDPVVMAMAEKYHKSYAQIMLRWLIEQGLVILPKSVTPSRIAENIDIFDFSLSAGDLQLLDALNRGLRTCWNPTRVP